MQYRKQTSIIWKLTDAEFVNIVATSSTFIEMLIKMGMRTGGGNVNTLKRRLIHDGVDFSHVSMGVGHNKGKRQHRKCTPIDSLLVVDSTYSRASLKRRLISEGYLIEKCQICGMKNDWNGMPLVMILDHINGINNDNRIKNLRLVCPNCNSQLPTHAGRNNKRIIPSKENGHLCPDCGNKKSQLSKYCKTCRISHDMKEFRKKYSNADILELKKVLTITKGNLTNAGKYLNMSGASVKQRCKKLRIDPLEFRPDTGTHCKCGKKIQNGCRECITCYRKTIAYVPRPSKDELLMKLRVNKISKVAIKFKTNRQVVLRWCKSYNLPTSDRELKNMTLQNV